MCWTVGHNVSKHYMKTLKLLAAYVNSKYHYYNLNDIKEIHVDGVDI